MIQTLEMKRNTDNDRRKQPGEPSEEVDVHILVYVAERGEQTERGVGDFVQIIQISDAGHHLYCRRCVLLALTGRLERDCAAG